MRKPKQDREERNWQVALLKAEGLSHAEISTRLKIGINTVTKVLRLPGMTTLVAETKRQIADAVREAKVQVERELPAQIIQTAGKALAEKFNAMAPVMADNLQSLALEAESEMVRLKATESWLDRSTDAPKREIHSKSVEERTERRVIIDAAMIRQLKLLEVPDGLIDVTPESVEVEPPARFAHLAVSAVGTQGEMVDE